MKKIIIMSVLILPLLIFAQSGDDTNLQMTALGFSKIVDAGFDSTLAKVKAEFKKEGFGVLTEVDVQATMKNKMNVDFRPYHILGVCNPPLAHKALTAETQIGLLLPCKVIVYENENGETVVAAVDPVKMMQGLENEKLSAVAQTVQQKFRDVLSRIN